MRGRSSPEFRTLFEAPGLPRFDLPAPLGHSYGAFGLATPVVYANFVSSIDGVVAIPGVPRSSALISGGDAADRFVVALLPSTPLAGRLLSVRRGGDHLFLRYGLSQ